MFGSMPLEFGDSRVTMETLFQKMSPDDRVGYGSSDYDENDAELPLIPLRDHAELSFCLTFYLINNPRFLH